MPTHAHQIWRAMSLWDFASLRPRAVLCEASPRMAQLRGTP